MERITDFFKGAFKDMAEGARIQHEADKANLEAARLEARLDREHAKNRPLRDLAEAKARKEEAQERLRREREFQSDLGAGEAGVGREREA